MIEIDIDMTILRIANWFQIPTMNFPSWISIFVEFTSYFFLSLRVRAYRR